MIVMMLICVNNRQLDIMLIRFPAFTKLTARWIIAASTNNDTSGYDRQENPERKMMIGPASRLFGRCAAKPDGDDDRRPIPRPIAHAQNLATRVVEIKQRRAATRTPLVLAFVEQDHIDSERLEMIKPAGPLGPAASSRFRRRDDQNLCRRHHPAILRAGDEANTIVRVSRLINIPADRREQRHDGTEHLEV